MYRPVMYNSLPSYPSICSSNIICNISNPTIRTRLDFKTRSLIQSEAKPRTGPNCEDLKSSPVRTGGFGITSKTNELLITFSL